MMSAPRETLSRHDAPIVDADPASSRALPGITSAVRYPLNSVIRTVSSAVLCCPLQPGSSQDDLSDPPYSPWSRSHKLGHGSDDRNSNFSCMDDYSQS